MKTVILSLFLLFGPFLLSSQHPAKTLVTATAALDAARPVQAKSILEELPVDRWGQAHLELAMGILFQLEAYDEVFKLGKEVNERYALSSESLFLLIYSAIEQKEINFAITSMEETESFFNPGESQLLNGMIWLQDDDLEMASQAFDAAIAIDPELATAWYYRATLLTMEEDLDQARKAFKYALELDERAVRTYKGLSNLYIQQEEKRKALAIYQRGIQNNPESESLLLAGAELALDLAEYDLARSYSRQGIKINSQLAAAHANLGMSYFLEQDYQQALGHLMQATHYRNDGGDHYFLGLAAIRTRNMDQAHRHLEMALSLGFERDDLPQLVEHCRSILASFDQDEYTRPY